MFWSFYYCIYCRLEITYVTFWDYHHDVVELVFLRYFFCCSKLRSKLNYWSVRRRSMWRKIKNLSCISFHQTIPTLRLRLKNIPIYSKTRTCVTVGGKFGTETQERNLFISVISFHNWHAEIKSFLVFIEKHRGLFFCINFLTEANRLIN